MYTYGRLAGTDTCVRRIHTAVHWAVERLESILSDARIGTPTATNCHVVTVIGLRPPPDPRHHLTVPRYRRSTFGRQAFSVGGPTTWNALPDAQTTQCRWLPANVKNSVVHQISLLLYSYYSARLRCRMKSRYINLTLTLKITYSDCVGNYRPIATFQLGR